MKALQLVLLLFSMAGYSQKKTEKTYIGYEKICWGKTANDSCVNYVKEIPNQKWFHENLLKIRNDSVFLDKNPISKVDGRTLYSASDGGFYYYSGIVKRTKSKVTIELTELFCDYCAEEVVKDGQEVKKRKLFGTITEKGIEINGVVYKETKPKRQKLGSEYRNN